MTEPFSIAKLRNMVRHFDVAADDLIAVSFLFPPDRVMRFTDHRGTVWAVGEAAWKDIEKEASQNGPALPDGHFLRMAGMPVYLIDHDHEVSADIKQRVLRSMQAAVDVGSQLAAQGYGPLKDTHEQ
jgi:hypothetical protein